MDNGFCFDGKHSLNDWGVIAIKDKKRTIAAPGEVLSYRVGGLQGTVAFKDQQNLREYNVPVKLYAERDLGSETAATQLWRQLAEWLMAGRRKLIWDSEPDKYLLAECTELVGDPSDWIEEGLKVTFKVQPGLRSVQPDRLQMEIAGGDWHDGTMYVDSGLPAPVELRVINTGVSAITGVCAVVGARGVRLEGLTLEAKDTLLISMEVPAGAEILHPDGTTENALPHALLFERLEARGTTAVSVKVEGGDARAEAVMTARGVWR